jgi:hypothetical protein
MPHPIMPTLAPSQFCFQTEYKKKIYDNAIYLISLSFKLDCKSFSSNVLSGNVKKLGGFYNIYQFLFYY